MPNRDKVRSNSRKYSGITISQPRIDHNKPALPEHLKYSELAKTEPKQNPYIIELSNTQNSEVNKTVETIKS